MKIYCVEDDSSIRELVVYTLRATGYEAEGFSEAQSFYKAMEEGSPDIVLLDIMLPGEDGLEILKKIRGNRKTADLPVMMLTAKGTEYDKVLGLDSGADDYMVKPFGMMELLSRINALLRRTLRKQEDVMVSGKITMNRQTHETMVDGEVITVTNKEYELLEYFLENQNIVLPREKILEKIWGYSTEVETRTLDVHIRSLRQKLGSCGEQIETLRGVGYRLRDGVK